MMHAPFRNGGNLIHCLQPSKTYHGSIDAAETYSDNIVYNNLIVQPNRDAFCLINNVENLRKNYNVGIQHNNYNVYMRNNTVNCKPMTTQTAKISQSMSLTYQDFDKNQAENETLLHKLPFYQVSY